MPCYRYVEYKYKLEIGAAQTTQLSKAITNGADKGVFVLPKGTYAFESGNFNIG
jgi:hypothetical protein